MLPQVPGLPPPLLLTNPPTHPTASDAAPLQTKPGFNATVIINKYQRHTAMQAQDTLRQGVVVGIGCHTCDITLPR